MDHQTTPTAVATRPASAARIGLLGAVAAAVIGAAILIAGTTATPAGTLAAANGSLPNAVDTAGRGLGAGHMDGDVAGFGGRGFGGITISSISGSNVSLITSDGWTRTIAIASDTTLTKGTATITLTDLKVGDGVRFAQTRQTNGSYTITKLNVVLPHAGGTVTAVSSSSITVTQRDGSTVTINVGSSTAYEVGGTTGKALTDVKVGMLVGAVGTLNTDGSLTATAVRAVDPASFQGDGDHHGHRPLGHGTAPAASPDAPANGSAG
ncbi:MAG: DUF5666 domain-containing protein [Chloroflexota bacterium]